MIAVVPLVSAIAALVVALFAVGAYQASKRAEHDRVRHLSPAAAATERLHLALLDQETGVRGFVITGDEAFLEPYETGVAAQDAQRARLASLLTEEHPELLSLTETIDELTVQWHSTVAEPAIDSVRADRLAEADAIVSAESAKDLFDRLRAQFDVLSSEIEASRTASQQLVSKRVDRLFIATILAGVVAVAAAALTWLLARRRVAAPLERLADQASTVANGRLDTAITAGGPVEIATVARSVEQMRVQLLGEIARAFSSGMVEAEEAERTRLAGELHDDPIQVLTSAQWRLEALAARLGEQERAAATSIAASLAEVQARLRTLMFRLHSPGLEEDGLTTALDDLLLDTFDGTDTDIRLHVDVPDDLAASTTTLAYRITAEAIRNVRKHAAAGVIDVAVRGTGDGLQLSVIDDGIGASSQRPTTGDGGAEALDATADERHLHGTGISRALATAVGGWWHMSSRPGAGTTVTCWLPLTLGGAVTDPDTRTSATSATSALSAGHRD